MEKMKKFLALLIAMAMVLSMGMTVFANGETGGVGEGEIKSHSMAAVTPNAVFNRVNKSTANITWDNQGDNVFYEVYLQNNKIYEGQNNNIKEENLVTGKEYTYRIRSYIIVSGEKQYSNFKEVSVRCLFDRIDYFIPTLSASLDKINVDFDSVSGNVNRYALLATSSLDEPFVEIASSNTSRFSNVSVTPGKTYYLKVAAIVKYNNKDYYDEDSLYIKIKSSSKTPGYKSANNITYNSRSNLL